MPRLPFQGIFSRPFRRRFLRAVAAVGLLNLFSASVFAQVPATRVEPEGQVVIGVAQEPTRFHPLQRRTEVDDAVHLNVFSTLWSLSPEGNLVPDLAVEVPSVENGGISADGLEWRIKLRPDVTWHDGAPFTAEDVKFTIETLANPSYPSPSRHGHELVRDIEVVSPTEVRWRLERPFAPYLAILAWAGIAPQHILAGVTDPADPSFNNSPVGTGPFRFGERRPGDHVSLVANDKYHGQGPFLKQAVLKYIPDQIGLKTQFITGAVDAVLIPGIAPDLAKEVERAPGVKVHYSPNQFVEIIALNTQLPQFQDPAVREALYLALDKNTVFNEIYPTGTKRPTESFLPEQSWAYKKDLPEHRFDLGAARALLDKAGWKPGADGIREKDGTRLAFSISTIAGDHLREQFQQLLQQDWRSIGVDLSIKNAPSAALWGDFWRKSQFDSIIVGLIVPIASDPDPSNRFGSWAIQARGGTGLNTFQYDNPEVDRLLREGVGTFDRERRKQIYFEIQDIVRRDLPYLPLVQGRSIEGTKNGLVGYQPNLGYRVNAWNLRDWRWEK
ncbi:peptide ABC transporter substrate-binding protein [Pseudochelatococcus contaminans]|uniref:Peptide/nickel transport system substrate-binding protein n=1 Tax=Pseudochelatococcus contaminans TaxID=1538103 RepID=A0A7W5Z5W6_9HYPH|nr:peptide ABC transporter substrate-binding protein [Pseudochelatococcus contaminans]MBB3810279.1 peptide/nickel transport system substrate-binding protein [Pseudochelatococcus contaminans]